MESHATPQQNLECIIKRYRDAQQTVINAERAFKKNPTPVNLTAWTNAKEQLSRTPQQLELPLITQQGRAA
jgi:hypothetical protein